MMGAVTGKPDVDPIGKAVREKLQRVIQAL